MKSYIKELSKGLKEGRFTARDLAEKYIAAVDGDNPRINAYVHTTFDEALACADYADKLIKSGKAGYLTGIPFILKDNICTDGILTTCCSKILQGFKPCYSATVWKKLKAEGAVLLGKANMDEFAMGSTGETSFYGATKNPWNVSYVAGGSSSGVAGAVSAHIAPYGLGSDTGGSIRQPASFCGVVGFKPSYGAVSRYGLIAYASSLDQIGPVTNSVEDAAIVFDAIRGKDKCDGTSVDLPCGKTALVGDVKGKRIGIVKELFDGVNDEVKSSITAAVRIYEKGGATVREISIPALNTALSVYYIIACAEASSNLGRYDGIRYGYRAENYRSPDDMIVKTRSQGFGGEVKKRIMLGTYVLSSGYMDAYYKKACLMRESVTKLMDSAFEKCDFLITPTAPRTAFPAGYSGGNAIETYLADACTVPVNIAGLPAISVPCGKDGKGLPIGLQVIGARYVDSSVLDFAYYLEREGVTDIGMPAGGIRP